MLIRRLHLPAIIATTAIFAAIALSAAATDLATLQQNYVAQGYGMFLHYNMGSYTNEEWAHSGLDVNTFNPTASIQAGTDQWAATAKAAGMKDGVLTTKHHDGFALWDTDQSAYDVASTSWYSDPAGPNYHVDMVKSYADSFRAQGLGVGLYYSIADRNNGIGPKYYSDNPNVIQKSATDATAYVEAELNHLLTSYGPISVLWTDGWGYHPEYGMMGADYVNYNEVSAYIKQISPNTLLLVNAASWSGDIVSYETTAYGMPPDGNTVPSELCDTLAPTWFYNTSSYTNLKSASTIGDRIRTLNSRNTTYSLDVTPDRSGAIPQVQVQRLLEIKANLDNPPPTNLALAKTATQSTTWKAMSTYTADKAVDGDQSNFSHTASGDYNPWWKVDLGQMTAIGEIDLFNRLDMCGGRLRDITVQILAADGTTLYTSPLLNPGNSLGGGIADYTNGPNPLALVLGNSVVGKFIRVSRTPEAGYASDSTGNTYLLTLAEVGVYQYVNERLWTGKTNSDWNATEVNWKTTMGGAAATYVEGTIVKFRQIGSTMSYTVNLPGTVAPGGVVVDNTDQDFVIGGTGSITGSGGLTKTGAGRLILDVPLTYTGSTAINGGTLVINTPTATLATITGSGELSVGSGTTLTAASISVGTLTIGNSGTMAVPEPSTLFLGAMGVIALAGVRLCRKSFNT